MAGDGFEAEAVLTYKSDPSDISKCKAKNGLDKGVHFSHLYVGFVYGFDYADQRYYAAIYGWFNTADHYQAAANGASNPQDPTSCNRYAYVRGDDEAIERAVRGIYTSCNRCAYVRGDPINRVDASGKDWCDLITIWARTALLAAFRYKHTLKDFPVFALRFSPDGRMLAVIADIYGTQEVRRSHLLVSDVDRPSADLRQFEIEFGILENEGGRSGALNFGWTAIWRNRLCHRESRSDEPDKYVSQLIADLVT